MLSDDLNIYQSEKFCLANLKKMSLSIVIRSFVCCFFLVLVSYLLHTTTGLRLWHCHHSLGRCQVQLVAEPKAGNASQAEETAARDGEEDAD